MARLLVEIDEDLKKDLKVRLIRDGVTLKDWVAKMAAQYVEAAKQATTRAVNGQRNGSSTRDGRHDDYLD